MPDDEDKGLNRLRDLKECNVRGRGSIYGIFLVGEGEPKNLTQGLYMAKEYHEFRILRQQKSF